MTSTVEKIFGQAQTMCINCSYLDKTNATLCPNTNPLYDDATRSFLSVPKNCLFSAGVW